jgi:predicted HicB family RNase H-like nuclease
MIKLESNTSCTLKKLSILIDKELHKEIKKKALAQDTTLTDLITTMITTYLKENS